MNDPFAAHNVTHLSASSINEYIACPARWLLHVSGYRDKIGIPAMWRGKAVDKAITKFLLEPDTPQADILSYAVREYNLDAEAAQYEGLPFSAQKAQDERENVQRYVHVALPHFASLGAPIAAQKKIKLEYEELPIPIIGYLDLQYDGVVRDIKTVGRMPSKIPTSTCRQLAIYAEAEGNYPIVDYIHVTKSKAQVVVMNVPDVEYHLNVVRKAASNMMRLLAYSPDIGEVARLLMPDFDDWRWSEGERTAAKELWRL